MTSLGEKQITIGSESFMLKCTLDAFRRIPSTMGGFVGVFNNLATADPDGAAFIIAAATGKGGDLKEINRIAELLFKVGLSSDLFNELTDYVQMLRNKGQPMNSEAQSGTAGE